MDTVNLITSWFVSAFKLIANNIFTTWGFLGSALFAFPILQKLIKIFRQTF